MTPNPNPVQVTFVINQIDDYLSILHDDTHYIDSDSRKIAKNTPDVATKKLIGPIHHGGEAKKISVTLDSTRDNHFVIEGWNGPGGCVLVGYILGADNNVLHRWSIPRSGQFISGNDRVFYRESFTIDKTGTILTHSEKEHTILYVYNTGEDFGLRLDVCMAHPDGSEITWNGSDQVRGSSLFKLAYHADPAHIASLPLKPGENTLKLKLAKMYLSNLHASLYQGDHQLYEWWHVGLAGTSNTSNGNTTFFEHEIKVHYDDSPNIIAAVGGGTGASIGMDRHRNPMKTTDHFSAFISDQNMFVEKVAVLVDITHSKPTDLDITLIAPNNGGMVTLANYAGGSGSRETYSSTMFGDDAKQWIKGNPGPYQGFWRPSDQLSSLQGIRAAGEWILRVIDKTEEDFGRLNGWKLFIEYK